VPGRIDVLVITTDDKPEVIHFAPVSGPLLDAVVDFAQREIPDLRVGGPLSTRQTRCLGVAVSNVVREEPIFGFDFWTTEPG
jgi:hypothetical protein